MKQILEDLVFKSRLQRDVHSFWEERCKRAATRYKIAVLVLSGLLTFLAFAKLDVITTYIPAIKPQIVSLLLALLSFSLFLLTICVDMFSLTTKHVEHRSAINRYTALLRDVFMADIQGDDTPEATRILAELERRYRDLSTSVIPLTSKEFDRGEREYYKRKVVRRQNRNHPLGCRALLRLKAWWGSEDK